MDRTAWIAVCLCTLGLIGWYVYVGKQQSQQLRQHQQVAATASPAPSGAISSSPAVPVPAPSTSAIAAVTATATPAPTPQATPEFAEKTEALRNDDVEFHLTNRGGGISEAVLLNHIGQGDERVKLRSNNEMPIGAIIDQPNSPRVEEFTLTR